MTYEEWLDAKIAQIERKLSKMEKDPEYYSVYDILEGMSKMVRTCKKQYKELK